MALGYSTIAWISGLFCGLFGSLAAMSYRLQNQRQKALKQSWQGLVPRKQNSASLAETVLSQLVRYDMVHASHNSLPGSQKVSRKDVRLTKQIQQAGLGELSLPNVRTWRLRNAWLGAVIGGILGLLLSTPLAIIATCAGFLLGWASLAWALQNSIAQRSHALEKHLSEAIEVMCLGLRAGLSFERSLELYSSNFPSQLSAELNSAQQMWHTGLLTREDALRNLAQSYDSVLLGRMVESIVRSLRFGSPLANSLEDLAREARKAHRARVEEKVMKAPVKMMLPVGLLILPSMLLLVMGPIMLDLLTGF